MFSYIKGSLADVMADSIVVDVSGIGWHIYVTGQVLSQLPPIGEQIKVHTWLQVREDAMTLFGFLTKDDLSVFKLLLGVSGIGPKGALAVLSVMTTDDLRFAVLGDDAKAIAKTPGIGTKTAQRVILELKAVEHKLSQVPDEQTETSGIKAEAAMALTALGYSSSEALKAISRVEITQDMEVETLLKLALKNMAAV